MPVCRAVPSCRLGSVCRDPALCWGGVPTPSREALRLQVLAECGDDEAEGCLSPRHWDLIDRLRRACSAEPLDTGAVGHYGGDTANREGPPP